MSDADRKAARDLYQEGAKLQEAGKHAEALDLFSRSLQVYRAPTTALHVGQCQLAIGKLVEAEETFRKIVNEALTAEAPSAFVKAQEDARASLASVEPRVPRVKVVVTPPRVEGLSLTIDGQAVNAALVGVPRPINPGTHGIVVSARGYAAAQATVTVKEGESLDVPFALRAVVAEAQRPAEANPPPVSPPVPTSTTIPIRLEAASVTAGSLLRVFFDAPLRPAAGEQYWVTLVRAGAPDSTYGAWHMLAPGTATDVLRVDQPGDYEVRVHDGYPRLQYHVVGRAFVSAVARPVAYAPPSYSPTGQPGGEATYAPRPAAPPQTFRPKPASPSTSLMVGGGVGYAFPAGNFYEGSASGSTDPSSVADSFSAGPMLDVALNLRVARGLLLGGLFQYAHLGAGPASTAIQNNNEAAVTGIGALVGLLSNPDGFGFYGDLGVLYRTFGVTTTSSKDGSPVNYDFTGPELLLSAGLHFKAGFLRVIPKLSIGVGSYSTLNDQTTGDTIDLANSTSRGVSGTASHQFYMLGIDLLADFPLGS